MSNACAKGFVLVNFDLHPTLSEFLKLSEVEKAEVKRDICRQIDQEVDRIRLGKLNPVDIPLNRNGHKPESEIADLLADYLKHLTGGSVALGQQWPECVIYNKHEPYMVCCEHCYPLTLDGAPWEITSTAHPGIRAVILVALKWESRIPDDWLPTRTDDRCEMSGEYQWRCGECGQEGLSHIEEGTIFPRASCNARHRVEWELVKPH